MLSLGFKEDTAQRFAAALEEDGFETAEQFAELSLDDLQDDFNFKRGHIRMVEKWREQQKSKKATRDKRGEHSGRREKERC